MAKAVVTYLIIATAFVALFLLRPTQNTGHHRHVRLHRRLVGPHFDPLVTIIEHKTETNKKEKIEEEDEGYNFGEDGKLNLKFRLKTLFPMIDKLPKDGFIGFEELYKWNIMQAHDRMDSRTRKELHQNDINYDGLISFSEYLPHFSPKDIEKNNMKHGEAGWWMQQFKYADVDKDDHLNVEELRDFLHPEDSKNEEVKEWLLHDKIRRMDDNNDGMVNLDEFKEHAYDNIKTFFGATQNEVPSDLEQFSDLDLNKDRFLTVEELRPIRHFLFPGELDYAQYITSYLMREVDDNHDGQLSLNEILRHEDMFYNSIFLEDDEYEDEEINHVHDEF